VSGLHKPGELRRRNQGDVARPSSSDNHSFLLIYHLIEHGGEVLAEPGVGRFTRHRGRPTSLYSISVRPWLPQGRRGWFIPKLN